MLIHTLNRRFSVIMVYSSGNDADVLVCRDLWEENEREYLLVVVKNPDLVYRCAPFFTQQTGNHSFKDFVECFSRDGQLCIVFLHYGKPLFKDKFLEDSYFLNERLEIGKNLLSRMVLQNMPPSIQYEVLQDRNLMLDESLQVYFNYALEDISSHGLYTMDRVQMELGRIFRMLLRQEIETKVMDEVRVFVEDLEQCKFADYLEIYEAYDNVYVLLKDLQETGEIHPKSFLFRTWEKIKKAFSYVRPVLAVLIVGSAIGYLMYTVANPVSNTAATPDSLPGLIETIGTVNVE